MADFENNISRAIKENAGKPNSLKTGLINPSLRYVCVNYSPKTYQSADKTQNRTAKYMMTEKAKEYREAYFHSNKDSMLDEHLPFDTQEKLRKSLFRFKLSTQEALWLDFIEGFSAAMLAGQEKNFLDFDCSIGVNSGQIDCFKVTLTFNQFRQLVLGKSIVDDKGEFNWGLYEIFRETQLDNDIKEIFTSRDSPKKRACLYLSKISRDSQFYFFDEAVSAVTGGVIANSKRGKDIEKNWTGYLTVRINPFYCPFTYDLQTRKVKKQTADMNAGVFTLAGSLAIATYAAKKYRQGKLDLSQFENIPKLSENAKPVITETAEAKKEPTVNALTIYRYIKLCEYAFQEQKALGLDKLTKNMNNETILAFSKELAVDVYKGSRTTSKGGIKDGKLIEYGKHNTNKDGEVVSVNWQSYRKPIKLMTDIFLKGAKDLGVFDMAKDNPLADKVILPTRIVDETTEIDIRKDDSRIRVIGDTLNRIGDRIK